MSKMVVYELWEVTADSPEAAVAKVQKTSKKDSVVVAAASLNELAHPVHLQEAQDKFGTDEEDSEK